VSKYLTSPIRSISQNFHKGRPAILQNQIFEFSIAIMKTTAKRRPIFRTKFQLVTIIGLVATVLVLLGIVMVYQSILLRYPSF
jgi:hypothetical protein